MGFAHKMDAMTQIDPDPDMVAPDLAAFEEMAERAVRELPDAFRARLGPLVVHVQDFAEPELLEEMGIENPFELTGLYSGVALIHDSVTHPQPEPARVFIYRRPILDEWAERGDVGLYELVSHVIVHELGHHFGWSDEDMHRALGEEH